MKENNPYIITVAITGSVPKKSDNPSVPITVSEQIDSTKKCYDAGASLVHLHVRNDDELAITISLSTFKEISLKIFILSSKFSFIASITNFVPFKALLKSEKNSILLISDKIFFESKL